MKKQKIYAYSIGTLFALLPLIMFATYITYTEKYVMPILLLLCIISLIKLRKEL